MAYQYGYRAGFDMSRSRLCLFLWHRSAREIDKVPKETLLRG